MIISLPDQRGGEGKTTILSKSMGRASVLPLWVDSHSRLGLQNGIIKAIRDLLKKYERKAKK